MGTKDYQERIREILKPIQAEYDGDTPMLPGTIPEIIQALTKLITEAKIEELGMWQKLDPGHADEVHCSCLPWLHDQMENRLAELKQTGEKP